MGNLGWAMLGGKKVLEIFPELGLVVMLMMVVIVVVGCELL